jgi:chromosome segregation ATPase
MLFALLLAIPAFAQNKAAQIADVKNQIAALENDTPGMLKTLDTLKTEREDKIDFVGAAYDKAEANYEQEAAAFQQKVAEVKHQEAILAPSIDNYNQRVNAHNANQCTEKCTNGSCDGSCAWYTAEKAQLDANQAQLQAAAAPINAQKEQLSSEASNLQQTAEKLGEIRTNLNSEIASWKSRVAELKAQWEDHQAKIAALEAELSALYGSVNSCLADIPVECDKPAIGPDGKPILNQNCENMKAQCSKMFDGNR